MLRQNFIYRRELRRRTPDERSRQIGQAVHLLGAITHAVQDHRHVVIGLGMRLAARAREPNSTTRARRAP